MTENTIMSNQYSNLDSSRQEILIRQPPPRIIYTSDTGAAEIDQPKKKGGGVIEISDYYEDIYDEIGGSVTTFVDSGGNSALHIAVSKNDQFFASRLLDAGVDPNIVNHSGVTPLKIAIRMQFFEMAELLFKHGAVAGDDNVIKDFKSLQKNTVHIDEDLEYIDQFRARKSAVTRNSLSNSTPSDSFQRALKSHNIDGESFEILTALAEHVPTRGTEIDAAWVEMFQSLVHLVMAANKNTRQYYVEISDQIRCSLVKILKSTEQVDQDLSTANDTLVKQKIRDLCKIAASKLPKKLRLSAKLSVGIWALPDATKRMISEAASIVAVCNEISGLVNTLGIFPVLDTPLQIQFTQVGGTTSESIKYYEHPLLRNSKSTVHETERQNILIEMEEISHRYSINTERSIPTPEQKKIQFDTTLLELINQFEVAMSILGVSSTDDRDEVIKATAKVQMTGQSMIDTIENFEMIQELPSDLIFEETDAEIFISIGFETEGIPFPVNAGEFINNAIDLCKEEIQTLVSGFTTFPAEVGLHDTLVDCLELVKRLRLCAIAVIAKQIKNSEVEREKTEAWNKEAMANQKVKNRFQAWEAMVLENGAETSILSSLNSLDKISTVFTVSPDEDELKSASSGLIFDESGTLLGGKISKMVEFLTLDNQDPELVPIFLMTFHSFTTTPILLDLLQEQYDISPKQVYSPSMFEAFVETKLVQTKLKVVLVILHWVKNHYVEDFCDYEFLIIRLRKFTDRIKDDFQQLASQILDAMEQKMERSTSVVSTVIPKSSSVSERFKHMRKGSLSALLPIAADMFQSIHVRRRSSASSFMNTDPNYFLTDFYPSDFGRQLTILEFELYSKIPYYEILDQIWEGKILHEVASYGCAPPLERTRSTPGSSPSAISLLIKHTNDVNIIKQFTFWVATCIVDHKSLKKRVANLKYFIQTAQVYFIDKACKECNNLTGVTTIVAGLSMGPVSRLHNTWESLGEKFPKAQADFLELSALVSPKHQYAKYRKFLKELELPALPFLGVYLTDLTFLELGNPDYIADSTMVNFDKRRKIYQLVLEIKHFQSTPFNFTASSSIQDFLRRVCENKGSSVNVGLDEKFCILKEDELYDKSYEHEPKDPTNYSSGDD